MMQNLLTLILAIATTAMPLFADESTQSATPDHIRRHMDARCWDWEDAPLAKACVEYYREYIPKALPDKLTIEPDEPRRVLVITSETMRGLHSAGAAGMLMMLREAAEKFSGSFVFTEVFDIKEITRSTLEDFDAVVLNNQCIMRMPQLYNTWLPEYVAGGGGLFAQHGSAIMATTVGRGSPDSNYARLLGTYIDGSKNYGHPEGQVKPFAVALSLPDHPLVGAFRQPDRDYTIPYSWNNSGKPVTRPGKAYSAPSHLADELYVLRTPPGMKEKPIVLVEVDAANSPQLYPEDVDPMMHAVSWIRPYGKGRVFYTQLGHNMDLFTMHCVVRHMLDGLQYATGDLLVPRPDR